MNKDFVQKINHLYEEKLPFFFIIDYLQNQCEVVALSETYTENILWKSPLGSNFKDKKHPSKPVCWEKHPLPFEEYKVKFDKVLEEVKAGNSYLLNLTCETPVTTNYSLEELFYMGEGKYQLNYRNAFIHFSPEPFIKIKQGRIYSFPMKGTIDASAENAADTLISNEKELREQSTIVDLIRNDLSLVADKVQVDSFRYIEKIETNEKPLLTVSSAISGDIKPEYVNCPGSILEKILPAGSITGAPKPKTMEIIHEVEGYDRGFYTGVWGVFDGEELDSCVIIRYLEQREGGLVFKSGGGITSMSLVEQEYQEMIDKVYVPVF